MHLFVIHCASRFRPLAGLMAKLGHNRERTVVEKSLDAELRDMMYPDESQAFNLRVRSPFGFLYYSCLPTSKAAPNGLNNILK
jgi:hypothetical protein